MGRAIGTIGVYGFDEEALFAALGTFGADALVDTRQRRGVRGHEYAFANRGRLEARCAAAGLPYVYADTLAPTSAIRAAQLEADRATGASGRSREAVSDAFRRDYEALLGTDGRLEAALVRLEPYGRPVLLCVETNPRACHRSIAAGLLAERLGVPVEHLLP